MVTGERGEEEMRKVMVEEGTGEKNMVVMPKLRVADGGAGAVFR